jgi:hypothetical protein
MELRAGVSASAVIYSDKTVGFAGIDEDGQSACALWTDIADLAFSLNTAYGLKSDGTVVAVGDDGYGQVTGVAEWTDITQIDAGYDFVAGLKSDGSVVVAGRSTYVSSSAVSGWSGITQIATGRRHIIGLNPDGTIETVGYDTFSTITDSENWTDIVQVSAGYYCSLGLKSDGTVVGAGHDYYGQTSEVSSWTDVVQVAMGSTGSMGRKADGSMVSCGRSAVVGMTEVKLWTDIVDIAADSNIFLGLKSDGSVVSSGSDDTYGQISTPLTWVDVVEEEEEVVVVEIDDTADTPCTFTIVLTGDTDGTTDYTLPVKNLTARLRSGSDSYLSVTLPYTSEIVAAISARSNGDLYLYYTDATGTYEVVNVSLDSIQISKGTSSKSIVLTGYRQSTNDGTGSHEIVANATVAGDTSTITIPGYAPEILAGDSVSYDDLSITANLITLTAQASNFSVQTVYSEGS